MADIINVEDKQYKMTTLIDDDTKKTCNPAEDLYSLVYNWLLNSLNLDVNEYIEGVQIYQRAHPFIFIAVLCTILCSLFPLILFVTFILGSCLFVFMSALVIEGMLKLQNWVLVAVILGKYNNMTIVVIISQGFSYLKIMYIYQFRYIIVTPA